jgi:hypothetical protein
VAARFSARRARWTSANGHSTRAANYGSRSPRSAAGFYGPALPGFADAQHAVRPAASLAIAVMWLAVLFDALFGPDIVSHNVTSATRVPSAVIGTVANRDRRTPSGPRPRTGVRCRLARRRAGWVAAAIDRGLPLLGYRSDGVPLVLVGEVRAWLRRPTLDDDST